MALYETSTYRCDSSSPDPLWDYFQQQEEKMRKEAEQLRERIGELEKRIEKNEPKPN